MYAKDIIYSALVYMCPTSSNVDTSITYDDYWEPGEAEQWLRDIADGKILSYLHHKGSSVIYPVLIDVKKIKPSKLTKEQTK